MIYVFSVPHTGSRTLLKHLGIDNWQEHVQKGYLLHFGLDDVRIAALPSEPSAVHIPIRHPIDTLASWYSRRLSLDRCVTRCMTKLVQYRERIPVYSAVESIQWRVRTGPEWAKGAKTIAREAWERLKTHEIEQFYESFYGKI